MIPVLNNNHTVYIVTGTLVGDWEVKFSQMPGKKLTLPIRLLHVRMIHHPLALCTLIPNIGSQFPKNVALRLYRL